MTRKTNKESAKKVRIVVLGATGNIGRLIAKKLTETYGIESITLVGRNVKELTSFRNDICFCDDKKVDSEKITTLEYDEENLVRLLDTLDDSDIIVNCLGSQRKKGVHITREDLFPENASALGKFVAALRRTKKRPNVVTITNPADIINHWVAEASGWPEKHKFIGAGNSLDTMRARKLTNEWAKKNNIDIKGTSSIYALGLHSERGMYLDYDWFLENNNGLDDKSKKKLRKFMEKLSEDIKTAGTKHIDSIGSKTSAIFGPTDAAYSIIRAIMGNDERIDPCKPFNTVFSPEEIFRMSGGALQVSHSVAMGVIGNLLKLNSRIPWDKKTLANLVLYTFCAAKENGELVANYIAGRTEEMYKDKGGILNRLPPTGPAPQ